MKDNQKNDEDKEETMIENKAGYTAPPVACGWAGAIVEVSGTLVCSGIAKNAKNACAKSLGTVHDVYNEGEPSVGLFV